MIIHPFRAWRPVPSAVSEIACVPYDVINTKEARSLAEGKPDSFLHVIRPEIDLPAETDIYSDEVYRKGADNLRKLLHSDKMLQDEQESVYVYRLVMDGKAQTGIFTCVSVDEYDRDLIKKHEFTRPDKEDDRTRHISIQNAHAEPVMLIHQDDEGIENLISKTVSQDPLYDFTADDGIQHTIWKSVSAGEWTQAFKSIPAFFVADGHHRCKAASRVAAERNGASPSQEAEYNFFPAAIFAESQLRILAYNRVVYKATSDKLAQLFDMFEVVSSGQKTPQTPGQVCVYSDGAWKTIRLFEAQAGGNPVQMLDVYRLQKQVLEPIFGILDPRSDTNIAFIGGIRGTGELEKLIDSDEATVAFSMYPTSIQELMAVSDAGLLMPPKSTWFEPKLRSGLLIHTF